MNSVISQIRAAVATVQPFDELEREHQTNTLAWIDSNAQLFRVEAPATPPKHLVAYFVLIDPDHHSILLGDHRKAELWLPTGGHVDPNELPTDTVKREAQEELHQKAMFLRGRELPLFVTETTTVGNTPGHVDVSLWFLLRGDIHDTVDFDRGEFRDMVWFSFNEILASHPAIFDIHMHRFTHKLMRYLNV